MGEKDEFIRRIETQDDLLFEIDLETSDLWERADGNIWQDDFIAGGERVDIDVGVEELEEFRGTPAAFAE